MKIKYKTYWRKTGLKNEWGDIFLKTVAEYKPKHFFEIGVFCGVTARNVCELLKDIHGDQFKYTGIDLFGDKSNIVDEKQPSYLENQKFPNPLKNIYYNYLKKENLNSKESVTNFLKKFSKNVRLFKGNSNYLLKNIDINTVDFTFLDGGHSFETTLNDLDYVLKNMKKNGIVLCDDYAGEFSISGVKKAIDKHVQEKKLKIEVIKDRFAKIIT